MMNSMVPLAEKIFKFRASIFCVCHAQYHLLIQDTHLEQFWIKDVEKLPSVHEALLLFLLTK